MPQLFEHGDDCENIFSYATEGVDCYISPGKDDTQINLMDTMFTLMSKTYHVEATQTPI